MPACAAVVAMGYCCLATHHGPTGGSGETRSRLEVSVRAAQGAHGKAGGPFFMAALAKIVVNSSSADIDPLLQEALDKRSEHCAVGGGFGLLFTIADLGMWPQTT